MTKQRVAINAKKCFSEHEMEYITDIDNLEIKNSIVTLGQFDGNHIGHQFLFKKAREIKQSFGVKFCTVILTFDIQPANIVRGENLRTIQTSLERRRIHDVPDMDYLVEWPFNKETMSMSPEEFVQKILVDKLDVKAVVCGVDFCFGSHRSGNVETLKELGEKYNFTVYAYEKVTYKGEEVSSTRIREAISNGNLADANEMLGHPFSVISTVVHGKHQGSQMGFPTINFEAAEDKILPPNGVYATKTEIDGKEYLSVTNVGNRPTFDDGNMRTVETNILDFDSDVYEKIAEVKFFKFIRPEKKFDSWEDLKTEIDRNKEEVRKVL